MIARNKGRACSVEVCGRPANKRGLCVGHYSRWQKHREIGDTPIGRMPRAARSGQMVALTCRTCGCSFAHTIPVRGRRPHWCSTECKRRGALKYPDATRTMACCVTCEGEFMQVDVRQRYCSTTCRNRRPWAERARFPSAGRRNDERRAQRRGIVVTKIDRRLLYFVHDLGWCALCGDLVDSMAASRRALSASLDHIIPLARGGTHEWSNVQLAHFGCNAQKGWRVA